MSAYFRLPDIVQVVVLSEWIDTKTLASFDSAVCSCVDRSGFLLLLQKPAFVLEGGQLTGGNIFQNLKWLELRKVLFKSLVLKNGLLRGNKLNCRRLKLSKVQSLTVLYRIDIMLKLKASPNTVQWKNITSLFLYKVLIDGSHAAALAQLCPSLEHLNVLFIRIDIWYYDFEHPLICRFMMFWKNLTFLKCAMAERHNRGIVYMRSKLTNHTHLTFNDYEELPQPDRLFQPFRNIIHLTLNYTVTTLDMLFEVSDLH